GLVLGDIPDIRIEKDSAEFEKIPCRITVRHELSKIRQQYFTFIGPEGSKYLKEYLELRMNAGERLTHDSPIILPVEKQSLEKKNKFLLTTLLLRRIKGTIVKAGFDWRPYIFRIYFGTNLDTAEAKGVISHPWRQFIMGHKDDIEGTDTKREGKIDEGRDQYEKCLKFIGTEHKGISENDVESLEKSFTMRSLKWFGFSDQDIKEMVDLSDDELQKRISERKGMSLNNGHRQKVISLGEVESFLEKGWEYVNSLPEDKAIVKIPD
ncbi:MAG: site-specific integrase, partial [Thermoplasmatales archaeon]